MLPKTASTLHSGPPVSSEPSPLLELRGVTKRFLGVQALDKVDFDLRSGEVHALFGENGAGKSTIINIICGTFPADEGSYGFAGHEIVFPDARQARTMGVSPVFQDFSLIPELTVEQNLFLGREVVRGGLLDRRAMRTRASKVIADLGFALDPKAKVETLSRSYQQMVEITKALLTDLKVLVLDEPTASLTEAETTRLFELVNQLRASGVGIIYVSHRMAEIRRLADRITVLRDGRRIATVKADEVDDNELVQLMTGRPVGVLYPVICHRPAAATLEVRDLSLRNGAVREAAVTAHAGEITGIAGLVGCGKSELVRAIYGLETIHRGEIRLDGALFHRPTPGAALKRGVCYFPSDRVAEGLALDRPIRENASMAALDLPTFSRAGFLRRASERRTVQALMERLNLRPVQIEPPVGRLSGGNRQKVVLARGIPRNTRIFLFDEPTVGIDVGAKVEVYEIMQHLLAAGMAIVLVSSDLAEVLALSNRLYVMHRARVVAELTGADLNEATVLSHFFPGEAPPSSNALPTATQ
jgi:ribose transport system ATP-binding protein